MSCSSFDNKSYTGFNPYLSSSSEYHMETRETEKYLIPKKYEHIQIIWGWENI